MKKNALILLSDMRFCVSFGMLDTVFPFGRKSAFRLAAMLLLILFILPQAVSANEKKIAEISDRYQPCPMTPTTKKTTVNPNSVKMKKWNDFRNPNPPKRANRAEQSGTAWQDTEYCPTEKTVTG